MILLESCLLFFTAAALLWSKALGIASTWRFISLEENSNHAARLFFEKTARNFLGLTPNDTKILTFKKIKKWMKNKLILSLI
jgi:hypothetical protein